MTEDMLPVGLLVWKLPVKVIGLRGDTVQEGQCPKGKQDEAWIAHGWGAGYLEGHLYWHDGTRWIDLGALVAGTRAVVMGERGQAEGTFAGHENAFAEYDGVTWHFEAAQMSDAVIVDPYERCKPTAYVYDGQWELMEWALNSFRFREVPHD